MKKLVLAGLTLAVLAMAAPRPVKADTLTTAITATANAIDIFLTIDGFEEHEPPPPPPPPPNPRPIGNSH
jgi:hypothetical protein